MSNRVRAPYQSSKFAEDETIARQTIDLHRRRPRPEHEYTQWTLHNLGVTMRATGHRDDAENICQTMAVRRRTMGPIIPTSGFDGGAAVTLGRTHRYPEAADLYRKNNEARAHSRPQASRHASTKYTSLQSSLSGRRDRPVGHARRRWHGLPRTAAALRRTNDLEILFWRSNASPHGS